MKLIIAEKKELAEAIVAALPGEKKYKKTSIICDNYIVCYASGHLLVHKKPEEMDEKYKKWELESLPIYFENWKKKIISSKAELFSTIKNYILDPSITGIINAGDADQEGQYLIDEILEYCHNKKPVQRILISNNTLNGVKKALSKIEDNTKYVLLGKSAQARAISDMIVGFSLSRFFSIINKTKLTVGRVQTPTLSLVVNRDLEIENHIKEKYFELFLNTTISSREIKLKHNIKKGTIKEKEILTKLVKNLENTQGDVIISKKESYKTTPFPYNLENLQIVANKIYKYSPQKTLDITQELRDKHKAITYNRSSSSYLSEEHFLEAPTLVPIIAEVMNIKAEFKFEDKPECIKDSEAKIHHGIIPTGVGKIEDFTKEQKNIYRLISERYLIQFLEKIKIEKTEANLSLKENIFKTSSVKILEPGYLKYFKNIVSDEADEDKDIEEKESVLSQIPEGNYKITVTKDDFDIVEKETKPKKRYTGATLIQDMTSIAKYVKNNEIRELLKAKDKDKKGENGSIGTSATRAAIIEGLIKNGFLEQKGNNIVSTKLAREYLKILPESLKAPDSTALWWSIQEEIATGKANIEDLTLSVLEDVKKIISGTHKTVSADAIKKEENDIGVCPKCGGKIFESEKNFYCSNYKEKNCNFTLWKKTKLFGRDEVNITKAKAKTLLSGKSILVKGLKSKIGKEYNAYLKMEVSDKYVNLAIDKFKK